LNTTAEPLEGNLVKLTVTIPAADVDKAIAEAYVRVAEQVRVPGFRKGKAPRPVVDTYVGRERVLADAQEALVEKSYPDAIDVEELRPIDQPDMGELSGVVEGEGYTYVAEVQVRPEFTLSKGADKIEIKVPPKEAVTSDVDAEIEKMRERSASLEPVEDRGVEESDFVLISFEGLVDGEAYDGNSVDKYLYEMGSGQMPKEFDDALLGARPSDERQSAFKIPDTSSNTEFVGKTATFDITVHEIKAKQLPALDDEFASNAGGHETMDELRTEIKAKLDEGRAFTHARETERQARVELANLLEGEAPEAMVIARRDNMIRDFFNNLERQGISMKDYVAGTGVDPERIQKDIEEEARERVRQDLALEALFRLKGMEVTDADIEAEVAEIATSSDKSPEELRREWEAASMIVVLKEELVHRKATEWLLDNVKIEIERPGAGAPAADKAGKNEKAPQTKKSRVGAKKKKED
jgi:trigger factor